MAGKKKKIKAATGKKVKKRDRPKVSEPAGEFDAAKSAIVRKLIRAGRDKGYLRFFRRKAAFFC